MIRKKDSIVSPDRVRESLGDMLSTQYNSQSNENIFFRTSPAHRSPASSFSRRAVFLDTERTLIGNVPYNVDPARICLMPNAAAGLRALHAAGYRLLVISNQPGAARRYLPATAPTVVEQQLRDLLATVGVPLAGMYYCPHDPAGVVSEYALGCDCRKPAAGLIQRVAHMHDIDLQQSWMIGDISEDIEAGLRAGCQTILIRSGSKTEWPLSSQKVRHYVAADLRAAARVIIDCLWKQYADRSDLDAR